MNNEGCENIFPSALATSSLGNAVGFLGLIFGKASTFRRNRMDLWQHAAVSTTVAAALGAATGEWTAAAGFCVTGIFVDFDHFVDYWRDEGVNVDIGRFYNHFRDGSPHRLWLIGHAWEHVAVMGILAWLGPAPPWLWGAAAGLLVHLLLDQAVNKFKPLGYSILFRASVAFDARRIFDPSAYHATTQEGPQAS
jgi:hypothetical protein